MFERFSRKSMAATGAALLAALGVSGVAIAQAGNGVPSPSKAQSTVAPAQAKEKPGVESNAPENSGRDPDNVQYTAPGDPDAKTAAAKTGATNTSAGSKSAEAPGSEQPAASEQSGSEQPGSEVANDDGPGGHADEPANPNADHQFQGKE
jgi:cytoskeletal protein RodZ